MFSIGGERFSLSQCISQTNSRTWKVALGILKKLIVLADLFVVKMGLKPGAACDIPVW